MTGTGAFAARAWLFAAALAPGACGAAPTAPGRVAVADRAGLDRALSAARGGELIVLAPGDYGELAMKARAFERPVTLQSDGGASFARIALNRVQGLNFRNISVAGRLQPGETEKARYVVVVDSARITWIGGTIAGTADGNPDNDGIGLGVRRSEDIRVEGVRFHDLWRGAVFGNSKRVVARGNRLETMRSDGLNFAGVEDVVVADNMFRDFFPNIEKRDHADFIQFWARGAGPSARAVITGNIMMQGRGMSTQGIFIDNKTGRVNGVLQHGEPFRDFTITDNLYYGSSVHGISVGGIDGGVIARNTAVAVPGATRRVGINVWRGANVAITDNVACGFASDGPASAAGIDARAAKRARETPPPGNLLLRCRERDAGTEPSAVFGALPAPEAATPAQFVARSGAPGWRPRPAER